MANDSSLGGAVGANVFNFDTQKGVTNLLASLRASSISPEQKNELRDLVFQYMNGGKDQTVRISLENKISAYGITPIVAPTQEQKVEAPAQPNYEFGTSRPAPTFIPAQPLANSISTAPSPAPIATPAPVAPTVPEPAPAPAPVSTPVINQAPVQPTVAPLPVQEPAPVTPSASAPQAEPVLTQEASQGLQRIKEIKSLVNEKIGNPVNLVDINNEVGREYMSAMLDAMKKLNTGSSAVSAMKRLEDAYNMVEKTLAEQKTAPETPQTAEPEVEATESATPTPVQQEQQAPNPTHVAVDVPEETLQEAPTPEPIVSAEPLVQQQPEEAPTPVPVMKTEAEKTVAPKSLQEVASVSNEPKQDSQESSAWESEIPSAPVSSQAHSLAEAETKLKTPDDLPLSSAIETSSVAGDPLFTKDVDEGLQQLLSEWSIFKKSGFFGTGPNGRQHPLFLKIASLQIPLLLAGRFEGATQEIKQSITDYMNGWRYEQGIIYEHGENFEHYLRRVIKHIIDLQKKKRAS